MRKISIVLAVLAMALGFCAPAVAQQKIGSATAVKNEVNGDVGGRRARVSTGDHVYLEEVISTAVESLAQLRFDDDTNLRVGPSSTVRLNNHVYAPATGARAVTVNATKGVFRFVTPGHSRIEIRTPTAVLAVRG